jgi:hypothetical protein
MGRRKKKKEKSLGAFMINNIPEFRKLLSHLSCCMFVLVGYFLVVMRTLSLSWVYESPEADHVCH